MFQLADVWFKALGTAVDFDQGMGGCPDARLTDHCIGMTNFSCLSPDAGTNGTRCQQSSDQSAGFWRCAPVSVHLLTCGRRLCSRSWQSRPLSSLRCLQRCIRLDAARHDFVVGVTTSCMPEVTSP